MEMHEAVMTFSQSEKIKAGLIWMSQTLEILSGLAGGEKNGAERLISAVLNMICHETRLAATVAANGGWREIEAHIDRALNMVHSGVGPEATVHLSRALSRTTTIGQQAMLSLKSHGAL
jgi:hypothetical protein